MTVEAIAGIAAATASPAQAAQAVAPTAQQVARFQGQLQQPGAAAALEFYAPPTTAASTPGMSFRPVMDFAGQLSTQLRAQLEGVNFKTDTSWLDPQQAAAVQAMQESCQKMCEFGVTTLHFQFFTKGVQITDDSARALFQQV